MLVLTNHKLQISAMTSRPSHYTSRLQQREGITPHGVLDLATLPIGDNIQIVCDQSFGAPRPVVSVTSRRKIFVILRGSVHPASQASTRQTMRLGMARERMFANGRDAASLGRPPLYVATTKHLLAPSMHPLHISTMSISILWVPFNSLRGHRFLITCVDSFTRRCNAIPLAHSRTKTVILTFL